MTRNYINTLTPGTTINDYFLLKSHTKKISKTGSQFLDITIMDKTGTLNGKMWDVPANADELQDGGFVYVSGSVNTFRDALQVDIKSIDFLLPEAIPVNVRADLVPCIDENPEDVFKSLRIIVDTIKDRNLHALVIDALDQVKEKFLSVPAAKTMHHAELGGLVLHTYEVAKITTKIYEAMPFFNLDMTIASAALHDICKIDEFSVGPSGLVSEYSKKGRLLGHIFMGAEKVGVLADKHELSEENKILLQHLILSHHGKNEYGSPVVPQTMEALVLHEADDISAKFHEYMDAVEDLNPGEFSDKVLALNTAVYKPM